MLGGSWMVEREKQENMNNRYFELVGKMLGEIKYGEILLTIQDNRIVQVEQNKKIRLKS
jgi:hypothetical protein